MGLNVFVDVAGLGLGCLWVYVRTCVSWLVCFCDESWGVDMVYVYGVCMRVWWGCICGVVCVYVGVWHMYVGGVMFLCWGVL